MPPKGYKEPKAAAKGKAKAQAKGKAKAKAAAVPKAASSESRRTSRPGDEPPQPGVMARGSKVMVQGDGWGGGTGEYEATIVDVDDATFNVIFRNDDKKFEETHVLKEHCMPKDEEPEDEAPAGKKRRRI
eukprot:TRINITY_DN14875_c0_g8_i1.p1 TRINITY_DN14875_c0_g8~~TRINITY_DN14875_c0_g8_i1.p1  ORF type:complete len:130 (+),score=43.66 TRINITY_DN14875_c0_g8_i1:358-747(+)